MRRGFTIVELIVVVAIIAVLAMIIVPCLGAARAVAKLASCGTSMHAIHTGLFQYIAENNQRFPPFAFSEVKKPNVILSGHWGGISQQADPDGFFRKGVNNVNLWPVVTGKMVSQNAMVCPAADEPLANGSESYFPYSQRFSTYCMRMPISMDLFKGSPLLANYKGKNIMDIYKRVAGSQVVDESSVPTVMLGRSYVSANGECTYNAGQDALLADTFYFKQYDSATVAKGSLTAYPVNRRWMHSRRFNVLFGSGAVKTIDDDGTIDSTAIDGNAELPDDGLYGSTYADKIWRFFDGR